MLREDNDTQGSEQAAGPADPPFPPPYRTFEQTAEGLRVTETRADGSTQPVAEKEAAALARRWQPGAPSPGGPGAAPTPGSPSAKPPIRPLAPGNGRVLTYLDVPFAQKDEAKHLGAKWDGAMRKWYVPHGIDVNLFSRWWPDGLKQETKTSGKP